MKVFIEQDSTWTGKLSAAFWEKIDVLVQLYHNVRIQSDDDLSHFPSFEHFEHCIKLTEELREEWRAFINAVDGVRDLM